MAMITAAHLAWLDDGCCDVKYLDIWARTAPNYRLGQPVDESWHRDAYEVEIGQDRHGRLFHLAAEYLLRYRFYPAEIMQHASDFDLWERPMRRGDRIVQRIHVWRLGNWPLLDVIGVTEVQKVTREPRHVGFTYVTVPPHVTEGEWSADLYWREDGRVDLQINAISRPIPAEPARNHGLMRKIQQRAHQLGLAHFKKQVHAAL